MMTMYLPSGEKKVCSRLPQGVGLCPSARRASFSSLASVVLQRGLIFSHGWRKKVVRKRHLRAAVCSQSMRKKEVMKPEALIWKYQQGQ
ncbi:hypothetical protein BHE74_00021550 [Ensete ventricosum]|nr:hypothetical protein BHE74_00021550 [Ensete ventricosum]